ncbi:unknown [Clostridium sp. CAG:299]|nr:unknown [Clostridium sp. CAG:299]
MQLLEPGLLGLVREPGLPGLPGLVQELVPPVLELPVLLPVRKPFL